MTEEEGRGVGRGEKKAAFEKKKKASTVTIRRQMLLGEEQGPVARLLRLVSPPRDGSMRSGSSP